MLCEAIGDVTSNTMNSIRRWIYCMPSKTNRITMINAPRKINKLAVDGISENFSGIFVLNPLSNKN